MTSAVAVDVSPIVHRLRCYFDTHATRSEAWRRQQLRGIIQFLTSHRQQLIAALAADLHKPPFETATTELTLCTAAARHALLQLSGWMRPRRVHTPLSLAPAASYVQPEPYGVVLVVGAFNYPVQLTLLPLLTALSAGNCVLLKPSELSAATSALLCELLPRYVDPQAVACVEGGVDVMSALLKQRFDHIFFTGSERVGRIVARAAAEQLTPVLLELGGKSPVVVEEDADVALAAKRVMWGKLLNTGQSCTAPDYAFVHSSRIDEFVAECKAAIASFYPQSPAASPDFGRIISTRHAQRLAAIIDAHRSHIVCGGDHDVAARYIAPTLLLLPAPEGPAMQDELFGPVLPIIPYSSLAPVLTHITTHPKPLALYHFTTTVPSNHPLHSLTSSGSLVVNDCVVQSACHGLPFGGVGGSGSGRYRGRAGFDALSNAKSVVVRSGVVDLEGGVRYPPYGRVKLAVYEAAMGVVRVQQEHVVDVVRYGVVPALAGVAAKKLQVIAWIRSKI